jgi:hypothetical protein
MESKTHLNQALTKTLDKLLRTMLSSSKAGDIRSG